jgi:hypothetical protein
MSKYTTQVRFICEQNAGMTESKGFDDVNAIITTSAPNIFNFDFPIFDEDYRLPLEIKILRHYYTREICEETVGLWKLRLQQKLNEIMPYYNKLYESELIEFNPLYDVNYKRDYKLNRDGSHEVVNDDTLKTDGDVKTDMGNERDITYGKIETKNYNGSTSNSQTRALASWNKFSDTPQGGINGMNVEELETDTYLTDARYITDTGNVTNNETFNNRNDVVNHTGDDDIDDQGFNYTNTDMTNKIDRQENKTFESLDDYIENVQGKRGGVTYSKMLQEFRDTFLNIDAMILNDLKPLFFGLWE